MPKWLLFSSLFLKEMISALFFFRGELQIDAKNSNFEIFESAFYMKSGSMPLSKHVLHCQVLPGFS